MEFLSSLWLLYRREKKTWEPFRIYLLNSTANPAQFWRKLAVLLCRQLSKWLSRSFICSITFLFNSKNDPTKHFIRAFSRLISDGIGGVYLLLFCHLPWTSREDREYFKKNCLKKKFKIKISWNLQLLTFIRISGWKNIRNLPLTKTIRCWKLTVW